MIIQIKLGISDEETVNQIAENPYMQFFLGYPRFREGHPFASYLITHFCKRFSANILNEVNKRIALATKPEKRDGNDKTPSSSGRTGASDGRRSKVQDVWENDTGCDLHTGRYTVADRYKDIE